MEHPIKCWQDCTQVSERASEAARPVRPHDQRGDWHGQGDYDHGDNRLKVEDVATCRSSTTNDFCLRSYDARAWTHNWERATTAWSWGMSGAPRISTSCTGTGWLATTFSFPQQQVWRHGEGPGDRSAPTRSPRRTPPADSILDPAWSQAKNQASCCREDQPEQRPLVLVNYLYKNKQNRCKKESPIFS